MATVVTERPNFLISDRSRRGVVASDAYCELIGRERADVIGRQWDEWIDADEVERCRSLFQRAIDGKPERYVRKVQRADGSIVTIAATGSLVHFGNRPHVLGVVSALFPSEPLTVDLREHRAEVALYIEALAGSLANVVTAAGLTALGDGLSGVAGEAARIARELAGRHHLNRA